MQTEGSGAARFSVTPTAESHFSWLRTRLSSERTVMSYCRTSIALIGFGFTLYQFLDKLNLDKTILPARYATAPRDLALMLIATGLLFLAIGTWGYVALVRYLHSEQFAPIAGEVHGRWPTGAFAAIALLFLAGGFAFVAVVLRI